MPPLRILVADDHRVVRAGLRSLLESRKGWQVCCEATNGREAVTRACDCKPDVALVDIGMPLLNGVEAIKKIRKELPKTEILALTMHDSEAMVQSVLEAGARGYILKGDADDNLIDAVEALSRHKPYLSSKLAPLVSKIVRRGDEPRVRATRRLSPRQREIVQLLAEGKSNKEIADLLKISVKTAEAHRANIMLKLNIHSVADLVRYAVKNGIIQT